jgi:hypothetical protein
MISPITRLSLSGAASNVTLGVSLVDVPTLNCRMVLVAANPLATWIVCSTPRLTLLVQFTVADPLPGLPLIIAQNAPTATGT